MDILAKYCFAYLILTNRFGRYFDKSHLLTDKQTGILEINDLLRALFKVIRSINVLKTPICW
jgi:hypothetical protein